MNRLFFISIPLAILVLAGCSISNTASQKETGTQTNGNGGQVVTVDAEGLTSFNNSELSSALDMVRMSDLSPAEEAGLIYMREEEKLAHDVYAYLGGNWGQNVFNNIAASELTHTGAVKTLLDRYGVADPVTDSGAGGFSDEGLQNLYESLLKQGDVSLVEALKVGAVVEEVDIVDLQKYLAEVDNEDIALVYENLMRGSRNHLRAFVKNLDRQGITYSPQYLTSAEYEQIIGSDTERGNGGFGAGRR